MRDKTEEMAPIQTPAECVLYLANEFNVV